jgi:hypothetical protein
MRFRGHLLWLAALSCLLVIGPAGASDVTAVKKAIKDKAKGTYYLKTNAPYMQGRHAYGTYKQPLVTVSAPEGVKIPTSAEVQAGAFHAAARRLTLRVNDLVTVDEFEWDDEDSSLEIELEGTGRSSEAAGVLRFVNLSGAADFEMCWSETFSDVSLAQKYDWPDEVKKAVVAREVTRESFLAMTRSSMV